MAETSHTAIVNAWMDRVAQDATAEEVVQALDRGFAALWQRTHQTLGEITLTAIADRVLVSASERHPVLSALKIRPTGLSCNQLRQKARGLPPGPLQEGVRFLLVELLTVVGNLTADIITPSLHGELAALPPPKRSPRSSGSGGTSNDPNTGPERRARGRRRKA